MPTGEIQRGVSLYSYQEEYFLGTMTLEDQIAAVAAIGARGIEVVPAQTFPTYPRLTDRQVAAWHELHEKYGTTPTAYDAFTDTLRRSDRPLTEDELLEDLVRDIRLAERLGCSIVRVQINTPLAVFERAAPHAVDHGQKLAVEVHAPMHYEHRWIHRFVDVIHQVDNGHLGLMGDMSTFSRRLPRVIYDWAAHLGADVRLLDYVRDALEGPEPRDVHTLASELACLGASDMELGLAGLTGYATWVEPETLVPHIPYLFHVQAKFWEMVDDEREHSIEYAEVFRVLLEGGFRGYVSSEYEGNRFVQDRQEVDSVEQVRRQHAMFKTLLGETR